MKDHDPEMYALLKEDQDFDRASHDLAMQLRRAPTDQKESLKTKLTDAISKQFEARQKRRELELKRLTEELTRIRDQIKKRTEAKDSIIQRRLSELTGQEGDLDF